MTAPQAPQEPRLHDQTLRLAPAEEFAKRLEHFAQKAHVLAGLTSSNKVSPFDAYRHMADLWENLAETGQHLSEPVREEKPAFLGLTSAEARKRLRKYGPNQAVAEKKINRLGKPGTAISPNANWPTCSAWPTGWTPNCPAPWMGPSIETTCSHACGLARGRCSILSGWKPSNP